MRLDARHADGGALVIELAVLAYVDRRPLAPTTAQRRREVEVAHSLADAVELFEVNEAYLTSLGVRP